MFALLTLDVWRSRSANRRTKRKRAQRESKIREDESLLVEELLELNKVNGSFGDHHIIIIGQLYTVTKSIYVICIQKDTFVH